MKAYQLDTKEFKCGRKQLIADIEDYLNDTYVATIEDAIEDGERDAEALLENDMGM